MVGPFDDEVDLMLASACAEVEDRGLSVLRIETPKIQRDQRLEERSEQGRVARFIVMGLRTGYGVDGPRRRPCRGGERRAGISELVIGEAARRESGFRLGDQAGTSSSSQRRSSASRYTVVVVFAGLSASPAVAASRIRSYEHVVALAAA